jgi:hypothetical protein
MFLAEPARQGVGLLKRINQTLKMDYGENYIHFFPFIFELIVVELCLVFPEKSDKHCVYSSQEDKGDQASGY